MLKYLVTGFTKITGAIPMWLYYRPRILYSSSEGRKAVKKLGRKGKAIVISNHTNVYDFVMLLMTFPWRFVRVLMGEILFKKYGKFFGWFLKNLGGIYVDRNSGDLTFMAKALDILSKGGFVGIFPEGKINPAGLDLEYKISASSIALKSDAPIIPIYMQPRTKGKRANLIVGTPIYLNDLCNDCDPSVQKLQELSAYLKNTIEILKENLHKRLDNDKKQKS